MSEQLYINFDEYIRQGEPAQRERADAWRAANRNVVKGVEREPIFLIRFFRNLLLGEGNPLKNRYMMVNPPEEWKTPESEQAYGNEPNYMRDLPIHPSQHELTTEDGHTDFELTLRPTSDFKAHLLSRGEWVQVLEPQSLADEIVEWHQEAIKRYKK